MMKWFRKHNKQLLAVFASALLVIWLGGSAVENLLRPDPFNQTVGTAMGQKINGGQYSRLKAKLDLMDTLRLPWYAPWFNPMVREQLKPLQDQQANTLMMAMAEPLNRDKGATDWWLLDLEARKMGVTVSRQQVDRYLQEKGIPGAELAKIRDRFGMSTDQVFDTIAEFLRVTQAAVLASAGVQVTEPEIKDVFVRTHDQLDIRYAVLPAEAFQETASTQPANDPIPEAELQALFEKHKNELPGTGQYGFGYKIPDREVIQYVGGNVREIAATLPPIPEERARKYFEQHKDEFRPPTTQPATTQPTTQPAAKFEEVKDQVIDRLKMRDAAQLLTQAVTQIREAAWSEYTASKQALAQGKVPPTLAGILEQQAKQLRRVPLVYKETPLISQEQARQEPGIGQTSRPGQQGQMVDFATYAFNLAKEPKEGNGAKSEEAASQIEKYLPQVVDERAGDQLQAQYVFRVVDFQPAHAPASLAEVREQVERDARTLRALKKAEAAARQLAQAAENSNLKDAFNAQFAAAATQPATTQPYGTGMKVLEQSGLTRGRYAPLQTVIQYIMMRAYGVDVPDLHEPVMPSSIAGITGRADAQAVIDAAFQLAGPATTTQPVNKQTLVELPEQKAWAVVQVVEHKPAQEAQFEQQKAMLAMEMRLLKLRDFYNNWFKAESIRERTGWQPVAGMLGE